MRAVAIAEFNGTPIDVDTLQRLRENWDDIKLDLIAEVDREFRVYEGTRFSLKRFAALLRRLGIRNWPVTEIGRLSKSDDTFKEMARAYPASAFEGAKLHYQQITIGKVGRGIGRAESNVAMGVRHQDLPQCAESQRIYFRSVGMVPFI